MPPPSASPAPATARLVTGSTLHHVLRMSSTGAIGLVAVFAVEAINLFYITLLGRTEFTAALGYSGTLLFICVSVSIGLSIAATAIVARALGRGDAAQARTLAAAALTIVALVMSALALVSAPLMAPLMHLLGARGQTAQLALELSWIVLPSWPLLGVGMCLSGLLRATGDARRGMFVTLGAALATLVLDPILIFGLGLGVHGAAASTVLARVMMVAVGLHGWLRAHRMPIRPTRAGLRMTWRPFAAIALPAILTQVATPVGNAFVTTAMARFGDDAVAGWTIIQRLIPVAFGLLFALSGAVGPIVGQNYGARRFDRVQSTLRDSMKVTLVYVLVVWALLALFARPVANLFNATEQAHDLVVFFCVFVAGSFVFNGALFVANAAFNNLGHALYSTALNWGRATLGVIPFVWVGAHGWGATGALAGYGLGAVVFGVVAYVISLRVIRRLQAPVPAAT